MTITPVFNTDVLPKKAVPHSWADYIELLCLINVDGIISLEDLVERIQERKDLDEVRDLEDDIDGDVVLGDDRDHRRIQVNDWFAHIAFRAKTFKSAYPFKVSLLDRTLQLEKPVQSTAQKLYLSLLLSSNLSYIKISYRSSLTSTFEVISSLALKKYLPKNAVVHIFGKSPLNLGKYSGKLWYKLGKLSSDIRERVVADEKDFAKTDSGDNGLDIVGWIPLDDTASGLVIVFGQCACTEQWISKQHSTSEDTWSSTISMTARLNNMVFIPFCFRDIGGDWYKKKDIHKSIVMDRVRIIKLLSHDKNISSHLPNKILEAVMHQKEPLF